MGSVEANKTVDLFLINKLVEQYMAVMRTTLSSKNVLSKTILHDIHIKQKSYFFTTFKESRKSNDITIIDELNSHFNQYFSSAFNEINEENEWRNFYKSILNESKTSYLNQIKKLFIDKSFYFVEEFHKLNDSIKTRIIDEMKNKTPKSPDVKFDEYIAQLVLFMNEEFNHFVEDNKMRRDSHENLIKVKFNELLEEYDNQMEKVANLVDCELDLSLKHIDNKMNVIKEFSSLNTSSDKTFFETYSAKLEQSIDKRLSGVIEYWKDQMNEQKKLKQIEKTKSAKLIEMAIKYYREEMDKSYQNTLFIATEKLEKINVKIVKHIIAKYESTKERGNMAYDEYEKLIRDSLNVIFDEIKEKNHSNTPTLKAIGIDLGTTNSCVAYYQPLKPNGKVNVIENGSGRYTTPSYVAFNDSGQVIAGHLAKSGAFANHRNTIYSVKRLIGRQYRDEEVQNDIKFWPFKVVDDGYNSPKISVKVNGTENTYTPEEISAKVLEKMKGVAEEKLGFTVRNAVITVPAYFSEAQKQATIKAGTFAGLNVLKIITEPTAAAIAYQLNRGDDRELKKVLIYDFGGGTFDVSILVIDNRKIEVKAHGGDNHLGGDDIDNNIMEYCLQQFYAKTGLKLDKSTEDLDLNRLRDTCEEKKCQLSEIDSVTIEIKAFIGTQDLKVELTREKLEELNYHLFLKSMNCVEYVLNEAKLSHEDIDDIVLVGGTTRIPRVREMLSDLFDGKQLSNAINPDEAVAIGAAIQAAILNGVEAQNLGHLKVLDVAPMSLGVKVKDGFMSNIIDRNTKIPNKYIKQYTTSSDYQKEILVEVYEGEETMAVDNRLLGTFTLRNIPSEPKGVPLIDVSFEVNDEGKLDVKAKIAGSDEEEGIQITEHRGRLTDTQLQQLIKEYTQNLNL